MEITAELDKINYSFYETNCSQTTSTEISKQILLKGKKSDEINQFCSKSNIIKEISIVYNRLQQKL